MRVLPAVLAALLAVPMLGAQADDAERRKKEADADTKLGKEYITEIEKELRLSENAEDIARVERIGGELAVIANSHNFGAIYGDKNHHLFEYTFKVIDEQDVNAFSVPGGFIYVNAGLLREVESDDELAAVLAHEIAHAANRHVITLMKERSKVDLLTLPVILIAILAGGNSAGPVLTTASALKQSLTSGWSQNAELDADRTGFFYMTQSKYNPTAMLTFLERLAFGERTYSLLLADWGIFRTHPPSATRARKLAELLAQNSIPVERSKVTKTFRATATETEGAIVVKFGERRLFELRGEGAADRANAAVLQLNKFFDSMPEGFQARVMGVRVTGKNQTLVEFTPDDGDDPEALAASALDSIRAAAFSLSMRTAR